ncbi:hypothetical protein OAG85_03145 [Verrucomicrobiales bacterium]|nr:hypothetical protein [Verrucomicrobiales bacterium]
MPLLDRSSTPAYIPEERIVFNETLGNAMLATTLCALCQCAYQQTLVETTPPLKPEYQPPHMPIATALDDESELERRAELEREEKVDKVSSFLFDAIASVVSATIFGSETDEEKREKLWRKSHKRKTLLKKGYINNDDGPPPEGFPSQF